MLAVQVESESRDVAVLARAEQLARAADLQVRGGEAEPGAEVAELLERPQALARVLAQPARGRHEEVGIGMVVTAADAPAELIQLGQTEPIRAVHDRSCWPAGCPARSR